MFLILSDVLKELAEVRPCDSQGCHSIDATIEGVVPRPCFDPLAVWVPVPEPRDDLLGGELGKVFLVVVKREVHMAGPGLFYLHSCVHGALGRVHADHE